MDIGECANSGADGILGLVMISMSPKETELRDMGEVGVEVDIADFGEANRHCQWSSQPKMMGDNCSLSGA